MTKKLDYRPNLSYDHVGYTYILLEDLTYKYEPDQNIRRLGQV